MSENGIKCDTSELKNMRKCPFRYCPFRYQALIFQMMLYTIAHFTFMETIFDMTHMDVIYGWTKYQLSLFLVQGLDIAFGLKKSPLSLVSLPLPQYVPSFTFDKTL